MALPRPVRPGKLGRRRSDPEAPRLIFEAYLQPHSARANAPVPLTQDVDRCTHVSSWPMYANDQIGDCTTAAIGHMIQAWTAYAGAEVVIPEAAVLSMYSAVSGYVPGDPATDQGASMLDVLTHMRDVGIADASGKVHKVAAFAQLGNPADELTLGYVLKTFGTVYTGIHCPQSALSQFGVGPWTWIPGSPDEGGHAICLQRRQGIGTGVRGVLDYISWGAVQNATFGFQAHYAEEAWAVVSEDWVAANGTSADGLDLAQLIADAQHL